MTQNKVLCIYHANCADGLGAAWAVHRALGENVEFVAAKYGDEMSNVTGWLNGRDVLIVDFSFPLPVLRAMAQEARNVLVLDHHKTAQEDLEQIQSVHPGTFDYKSWRDSPLKYNLAAIFDLERSGAGITWDYLNPDRSRPRLIDLIEDRDLWKFNFGSETRAFHAVLTSYDISDLPAMFERLDYWNIISEVSQNFSFVPGYASLGQAWRNSLDEGRAILRANVQAVTSAVSASRRTIKIAGHVVPCANVPPSMASDAGHLLCQPEHKEISGIGWKPVAPEFSATYFDGTDNKRHFSLRSPEGGADVGQIAKQMAEQFNQLGREAVAARKEGTLFAHQALKKFEAVWAGGGHEHAAGFDAPLGWEGE